MVTISQDLVRHGGMFEYRYEPLVAADAVRVVVVHPAHRLEDTLRCSIVHYTLSTELSSNEYCSHRHYSAVSYTWGAAPPSQKLLIVPLSVPGTSSADSAYLNITPNVDSLLRHLRKSHRAVHLWIDAVCLNQRDEEEKAQQIPRMGDIYRAAKKLHIWLGDDNVDDARRAFSIIRQVEFRSGWDPSEDEVSALATFFERPWFTRRWIVQEVVLAHEATLHCGPASLALSWVLLALKKARIKQIGLNDLGYGPKMLLSSVGKYQEAPYAWSMLTLLWDLHLSECSDPRDRIAALYGLASARERPPDLRYNKGATRLYWDCATYFVNRDARSAHRLIFHLAEFGSFSDDPRGRGAPSWVPNWSRNRHLSPRFLDGLQDVLEPFHVLRRADASTGKRLNRFPQGYSWLFPGFEDYYYKFINTTQMTANGNSLRIISHPLAFPKYGGVVSEVYRCESSDWKDVCSLLSHTLINWSVGDTHISHVGKMLAALYRALWGKELLLKNLKVLILSCAIREQSVSPPQEDIQCLERIGSILSRFSLIRTRPTFQRFVKDDHRITPSVFFYIGPRNAAVGDFVVPLKVSESDDQISVFPWVGFTCLRPTSGESTVTCKHELDSTRPICRTVRWVGLIFQLNLPRRRPWSSDWSSKALRYLALAGEAWNEARKMGLPGPYIFDVV